MANSDVLEPVGSVAPKLTFLERFRMMQIQGGSSFNIQCPVQSYPMPVFKYVLLSYLTQHSVSLVSVNLSNNIVNRAF